MSMDQETTHALDRREAISAILAAREDTLIVTGLGSTTYDAGTADHLNTFYLWGAMGAAVMTGLGLALAQPERRVLVLTGDGEALMGFGAFATTGTQKPDNLAIVVVDNEHYSETGMQPTHTRRGVDLAGVARACGYAEALTVTDLPALEAVLPTIYGAPGPVFVDVKVSTQRYPMSIKLRDGTHIKNRFRENLLGAAAFD